MGDTRWMTGAIADMKEVVYREKVERELALWDRYFPPAGGFPQPTAASQGAVDLWQTYGKRTSHGPSTSEVDSWAVFLSAHEAQKESTAVPVILTVAYLAWWIAIALWRFS